MAGVQHVVAELHPGQVRLIASAEELLVQVKILQIYCCTQTLTVPGCSTPMMWEVVFRAAVSFSEQPGHLHQEPR